MARAEPRNARLHSATSLVAYLPWALLYPLYPELLVLVVVLGALTWLGFQTLMGLWLGVIVLAGLLAYLVEIVWFSANGHGTAPAFTSHHLSRLPLAAFEALLLLALVLGLVFAAGEAGPWARWGAVLGLACIAPAAFALFGLDRTLASALDPAKLFAFVAGGGVGYAVVAVLTALLLAASDALLPAAPGSARDLVAGRESGGAAWAVATVYGAFASAHLLGALVFLRREALGIKTTLAGRSADEAARETLEGSVARCWAQVDAAMDAEDDAAAERILRSQTSGAHAPHPWLEALFDGALKRPKPFLIIAAAERLIAHLVATKRWPRALEVYVHARQRWARFQPALPEERVALAAAALERGDALAFGYLMEGVAEDPAAQPELAFIAARWRAERDKDEAGARALLAPVQGKAKGPLAQRIAAYAAALGGASRPAG